jgi:hypothetical protein
MPNFYYYQKQGGENVWLPSPVADRVRLEDEDRPEFISVLAVSRIIDDEITYEDKLKLTYAGPLYFDWDSSDEQLVIEKVNQFLDHLVTLRVNLEMCKLFATGGRGYHLEIPQSMLMDKIPPKGVLGLPYIYREMAYEMAVDTLDLRIYSGLKGRMWRVANVRRDNGRYKVPIRVSEMRAMTPEMCRELTSSPRRVVEVVNAAYSPELAMIYETGKQKVEDITLKRKRFKPDPEAAKRAHSESIQAAMAGFGLKDGAGFHPIGMQLAQAACTAGLSMEQFITECAGLIANHRGDGERYSTPKKREDELRRMHRYMDGNACYEFSIGAIKSLLAHPAPDLDGVPISAEELKEVIAAADTSAGEEDEYGDVARGITLSKYGVYKWVEGISKRVCAVSFDTSDLLLSSESSTIIGYSSTVLVNGRSVGRQVLETEIFSALNPFNRFAQKYGHTFVGNDQDVRVAMMRFVEAAKKRGSQMYVVKREGLDVLSVPDHPDEFFRSPFVVWAEASEVWTSEELAERGMKMKFLGHPDQRGVMRTDLSLAPSLPSWLKEPGNKELMRLTLENLMSCQKADLMGKLIGWYVSCFWKQIFNHTYSKFPLLHVNGAAGVGKCLGRGTPVLLACGQTCNVEDIRTGDLLMAPDGGVRTVLSTTQGFDRMFRVSQWFEGKPLETYTVNAAHILSLRHYRTGEVLNTNVEDFLDIDGPEDNIYLGWQVPGILEKDLTPRLVEIEIEEMPADDYYGFTIDGDHLFLLGDFTVTHNTETNELLGSFFFYKQEVHTMSPSSTIFALNQHLAASASIPLIVDEYKPAEMKAELHNRMKQMFRDAYNQRQISRGGGTRESDDFRTLQQVEMAAPLVFIAEAAEDEAAVMERVVLATFTRPPAIIGLKNLAKFQQVRQHRHLLGILGQHMAAKIVRTLTFDGFRAEFDALYEVAQNTYMLTEKDLTNTTLTDTERMNKQNAKERSVFNHTVAKYGFQQFRALVNEIVDDESLDPLMATLEDGIYSRLSDLNAATTPEHIKVLAELAQMSHHVHNDHADAINLGTEYAFVQHGVQECIEIAVRPAYAKYRSYCRSIGSPALFTSPQAFMLSLKDSPAFVKEGTGQTLLVPKVFTLNNEELAKYGVDPFKNR